MVTFDPPIDPENWWPRITRPTYDGINVWKRESGETFDTLSLSPSIDVKGHWHGHISQGQIVQIVH